MRPLCGDAAITGIVVLSQEDCFLEPPEPPPMPPPIVSPGFGYYYPSRIYELRSGTPGYSTNYSVVPYGGAQYYY